MLSGDNLPTICLLPDADAGALIKALIAHCTEGTKAADLPEKAALVYPYIEFATEMLTKKREKLKANAEQKRSKSVAFAEHLASKSANCYANAQKSAQIEDTISDSNNTSKSSPSLLSKREKEREKKEKEKIDLPTSGVWADERVRSAFKEYAKMRVRIRKSMTAEAVKRKIPKLEEMTNDPAKAVEIINRATDNCWLDFYADKEQKAQPPAKPQFNFDQRNTDYDALLNG